MGLARGARRVGIAIFVGVNDGYSRKRLGDRRIES
jgi:hypothetical protein